MTRLRKNGHLTTGQQRDTRNQQHNTAAYELHRRDMLGQRSLKILGSRPMKQCRLRKLPGIGLDDL